MPEIANSHQASRLYRLGAWLLIVTPLIFFFLQQLEAIVYSRLQLNDIIYFTGHMARGVIDGCIFSVLCLPVSLTGVCVRMRVKNHITGPVGAISVLPFLLAVNIWTSFYCLPPIWPVLAFAPILIACSLFLRATTPQSTPSTP